MGVFNDNFLKFSIIFLAITWSIPSWLTQSQLVSLTSLALVLPYLFLSPLGGRLSLVYSPQKVFLFFKIIEIPIILLSLIAFYFQYIFLALFSVLLMGIQSSLYSPSKYSLIKRVGGEEHISYGTGLFEMMAFLGILIGTIVASFVSDSYSFLFFAIIILSIALFGVLFTSIIKEKKQPQIDSSIRSTVSINPIFFIVDAFKECSKNELLHASIFGSAFFWFIGSLLQMNIVVHASMVYALSNTQIGFLVSVVALCLGAGSWVAGKIVKATNVAYVILIALAVMTLLLLFVGIIPLAFVFFVVLIAIIAIVGGMFQVSCLSVLQKNTHNRPIGDLFAYLNLLTFVLILLGSALFSSITWLTNQNTFIVFQCMTILCFVTTTYFFYLAKKLKFKLFL